MGRSRDSGKTIVRNFTIGRKGFNRSAAKVRVGSAAALGDVKGKVLRPAAAMGLGIDQGDLQAVIHPAADLGPDAIQGADGAFLLGQEVFVVLNLRKYSALRAAAGLGEKDLPALPKADAEGNVPPLEYSRVSLARKIIMARKSKGWTQKQLADAAGIRVETVNRIEKGHNMPDIATVDKISIALGGG